MSNSKAAGLRDLLGSKTTEDSTSDPTPGTLVPDEDPATEPPASTPPSSTTSGGLRTEPPQRRPAASEEPPTASKKSPKKRSNVTLSEELVDRLTTARDEHRWTIVHLFETALRNWTPIDDIEAGRRLAATGPRHRQQGVRLSGDLFDDLDRLGEQWRMNRSETSTIVLEQRLAELNL